MVNPKLKEEILAVLSEIEMAYTSKELSAKMGFSVSRALDVMYGRSEVHRYKADNGSIYWHMYPMHYPSEPKEKYVPKPGAKKKKKHKAVAIKSVEPDLTDTAKQAVDVLAKLLEENAALKAHILNLKTIIGGINV